jgi:FlaG/FlaF family flagellin (archaellin)
MRTCCFCITGFLSLFSISTAYSQSSDDSLFNESASSFRNIYFEEIKGNALFYQGRKYDVAEKRADGFPYFQADVIRQGTITYQGTKYGPVKLYYDLVTDEVITQNYEHDDLVSVDAGKIDSFTIGAHRFVRLPKSNGLPKTSFYELLRAGDPGLYVRREKKFYFGTGNQENRYAEKNSYFILYKNVFYKSDSKAEMFIVFSDEENALKKYIHSSKINFKEDFESALMRCVTYYAGLKL